MFQSLFIGAYIKLAKFLSCTETLDTALSTTERLQYHAVLSIEKLIFASTYHPWALAKIFIVCPARLKFSDF
jgi:hypothetical protein